MKAKKVSELLYKYLSRTSERVGKTYSSLFQSWEDMVGSDAAAHSRIKEYVQGTVFIEVDHAAYSQLLQFKKNKIITALRKKYPELEIKKMKIITANRSLSSQSSKNKQKEPESERNYEELNKLLSNLKKSIQKKNDETS